MMSYWISMGPNSMTGVLRRRKFGQRERGKTMLTHTEAKPCENRGRDRSDVFIAK